MSAKSEDVSEEELKRGLTSRSFLSLAYAALLVAPIDVFLTLYMGMGYLGVVAVGMIAPPALYIVIILFTEISRFMGKPLTRQEVFIMYNLLGISMVETVFITLLYQAYFRVCPVSQSIFDPFSGRPMSDVAPNWFSPPPGAYYSRTFLNISWILPIVVALLAFTLYIISEIGMGFIVSYMFVEVEKLPFPTAPIDSEGIVTMAERDPERVRVFALSAAISIAWSAVTLGVPSVLGAAFGLRAGGTAFIDITTWLSKYIQGPIFGVTLEIFPYTFGWIWLSSIPVISMWIASYAVWFFGNWFSLQMPWEVFKDFQLEYRPGMTIDLVIWRAWLWNWAGFVLGAALGVAIFTILRSWRSLVTSVKSLLSLRSTEVSGYPPLRMVILAWLGGSIGASALIYALVPGFPIFILIAFMVIIPFVNALIIARGRGEVGTWATLPYMRETMILTSGYKGTPIWFAPVYFWSWGQGLNAGSYPHIIKVAKLTQTRPMDYFKGLLLIVPITWLMSFIIVSLFWKMAPIPSEVFPRTVFLWPESVVQQNFIMLNYEKIYKLPIIATGLGLFLIISAVTAFLPSVPINVMALVAGLTQPPHVVNAFLVGHLFGKYLLRRRLGDEWWGRYRYAALAGFLAGYGIVASISGCSILISKALWHTEAIY